MNGRYLRDRKKRQCLVRVYDQGDNQFEQMQMGAVEKEVKLEDNFLELCMNIGNHTKNKRAEMGISLLLLKLLAPECQCCANLVIF